MTLKSQKHTSVVNWVRTIDTSVGRIITKRYGAYAKGTGIPLPIDRALIECRVAKLGRRISKQNSIYIPDCERHSHLDAVNHLEYVDAIPLRGLPICDWPDVDTFGALGEFIASMSLHKGRRKVFSGLAAVERALQTAILAFKASPLQPSDAICGPHLNLGDVSLGNLLFDGTRICVIDFEFAHLGRAGYDVGQLTAELSTHIQDTILASNYIVAVTAGYTRMGGNVDDVEYWMERMFKYYRNKV